MDTGAAGKRESRARLGVEVVAHHHIIRKCHGLHPPLPAYRCICSMMSITPSSPRWRRYLDVAELPSSETHTLQSADPVVFRRTIAHQRGRHCTHVVQTRGYVDWQSIYRPTPGRALFRLAPNSSLISCREGGVDNR